MGNRGTYILGIVALAVIMAAAAAAPAQPQFVLPANMKVLRCEMPNTTYRFAGIKGQDQGEVKDFAIEIQEITTRDPEARIKEAYTDTGGNAPLLGLEGKPVTHPITVRFGAEAETAPAAP